MSADPYFCQGVHKHDLRHKTWEQFAPPKDPTKEAALDGHHHRNAATGKTLFSQSAMPIGIHVGKDMERVPARYLLRMERLAEAMPSGPWREVADYVKRHREEIVLRKRTESEDYEW